MDLLMCWWDGVRLEKVTVVFVFFSFFLSNVRKNKIYINKNAKMKIPQYTFGISQAWENMSSLMGGLLVRTRCFANINQTENKETRMIFESPKG
jgi:asparagine N-glycosylation enzyme membrane subunit Stt3